MSMNFLENIHSAEWILNTAFQSAIITFVGWLFVRFFKHRPAPLRSAIVILTLLILAVLPLLNLPSLSLVPESIGPNLSFKIPSLPAVESNDFFSSPQETADSSAFKGEYVPGQLDVKPEIARSGLFWITIINIFGLLWIAVALVFFLRFLKGTLSLRKLIKGLSEVDFPHLDQILAEAQTEFPRTIQAKVYESTQINSPMALGFFKPSILFPTSSIKKMSHSKFRGILIHELSHIYHRDHLIGVLQRLVSLFNWWNPLTYALSSALSRAREEISDNHVLLRNDSREYARCLVELVEKTSFFRRHPVATAMASAHIPIQERVKLILSKERNMETRLKKTTLVLAGCLAFLFLILITGYRLTFASVEYEDVNPTVSAIEPSLQEQSQSQEKQTQKTDPIRATGKIEAPKLIKKVDPVYPDAARKEGIEGIVILEVTTDKEGLVQDVKVLRSIPALDDAAIEAVKKWEYKPMIIDGEPHGIIFTITCNFKLSDKEKSGVVGGVAGGVQGGVEGGVEGGVKGGVEGGVEGAIGDAASAQVIDLGNTDSPQLIERVEPVYPKDALKAGLKGEVVLEATIDEEGKVTKVNVTQSIPGLDNAAVEAVEQWIYEPYIVDGKPKSVKFTVTVRFHLR
jgi:TonB family protein